MNGRTNAKRMEKECAYPNLKNKGDAQCCGNYKGIKLICHTIKIWKRIIEARLRDRVEISKQQYGFMPKKGTSDAMFALVQERSKRATLCIRGPRKSLRQGSNRRVVVLYEKIRNGGKVCATCTGYV